MAGVLSQTGMADIVLATLNARFIHASFGLRYLRANLGELMERSVIAEFEISQRPVDVASALLDFEPKIIGLGVYIWNVAQTTALAAVLKRLRPDILLVIGGPEVSYEWETQPIFEMADYLIAGEADLAFADLCRGLLGGQALRDKVIQAPPPDLARVQMPYGLYTDDDLAHRFVYVEASRGCPYSCEFCLSSLDIPPRRFPLPEFLDQMRVLMDRGLRHFKFVDRTFNLDLASSRAILEFFLQRHQPGRLCHFELVPDRLPETLRSLVARFPAGSLQLEIGVQTFNEHTAALISRRQNYLQLEDNFRFLRRQTKAHLHADLIIGLPGEDVSSFAAGFDRLAALGPQEIQVGLLKRLRGAPIARHDQQWGMIYNPLPPYEILQTKLISFAQMQQMRRFARYWDLVGNSGNFVETTPMLWRDSAPFKGFLAFSDWLYQQTRRTDAIALLRLAQLVWTYLTTVLRCPEQEAAPIMLRDYQRGGRRECPEFLRPHVPRNHARPLQVPPPSSLRRQSRHQAGDAEGPSAGCL